MYMVTYLQKNPEDKWKPSGQTIMLPSHLSNKLDNNTALRVQLANLPGLDNNRTLVG